MVEDGDGKWRMEWVEEHAAPGSGRAVAVCATDGWIEIVTKGLAAAHQRARRRIRKGAILPHVSIRG